MKINRIEIDLSSDQLDKMKERFEAESAEGPLGEFLLSPEKRHYLSDDYALSNQASVRYELLKTDVLQNKLVLLLQE